MINHQHWHYDRYWGWQPIKARKLEVLKFIYDREIVTSDDLMNEFGYTDSSARCRLCQLRREGFIVPYARGQWCVTDKAQDKLRYHGVLPNNEPEQVKRKAVEEGRVWVIGASGRPRLAREASEFGLAFTYDEIKAIFQRLRRDGLV